MWLEYLRTTFSMDQREANSRPASLRCRVTVVPHPLRSSGAASLISYSPWPSLVQRQTRSSPALRLSTSSRSATMNAE